MILTPAGKGGLRLPEKITTMGKPAADKTDVDYPACLLVCPDFVLGTLSLTVTDLVEETLAPLDLRLRHYQLLRLLHFDGPRLQSTIGPVLGVDRTTVVALVDQLEKLKLAKRVRSPDDRRAYLIALTAKGKRLDQGDRNGQQGGRDDVRAAQRRGAERRAQTLGPASLRTRYPGRSSYSINSLVGLRATGAGVKR